jgi:uncharacterized membrane protein
LADLRRRWLSGRVVVALLLAVSSVLLVIRDVVSGHGPYDFLEWNAFLAAIPYALAVLARAAHRRRLPRPVVALVGGAWLLFLPNAFYIVSDFVHLGEIEGMSVWYDAVMIGAFACVGLVFRGPRPGARELAEGC